MKTFYLLYIFSVDYDYSMPCEFSRCLHLPQDVQRQSRLNVYNGLDQLLSLQLTTSLLCIVGHPEQLRRVVVWQTLQVCYHI